MKRRQLLKFIAQAGLFANTGLGVSTRLHAADGYAGPLWIMINAQGGWDVTSLCDPKGYNGQQDKNSPDRINNYDSADIQQAGAINYAPPPDSFKPGQPNFDAELYSAKTFFEKYYQKLLVINGIDCKTNSHSNGQLFNLSGRLREGYPAFPALLASVLAPNHPLSFLTYGGYSHPADLITPIRMSNASLRAISEIAYPNRSSIPKSSNSRLYQPTAVEQLIEQTNLAYHQELLARQNLPRIRRSLEELINSRRGLRELQGLADNLELSPMKSVSEFKGREKAHRIYQQGRIALAAFQQGVTSSVNININGFDTHSKHDQKHYPLLMDLLQGVDAIIEEAQSRALENKIVIVMLSDFARTNKYNMAGGKDHWPVGSMMLMGNSQQVIRSNRVIGETSSLHKAFNIDPVSLIADTVQNNPQAVKLTPAHVHLSLRRLAAIEKAPASIQYGLEGQTLPLFE